MANIFEIIQLGLLARVMDPVTKLYYFIFAVLTIVGGVMGFVKARSAISLWSGIISGLILVIASTFLPDRPIIAGVIGLCVSVLLAGKFVPDYIQKKAFVPAGLMSFLSVASIVISILTLVAVR
jgi:uncharacterized membrane protein (UPF0136 family)